MTYPDHDIAADAFTNSSLGTFAACPRKYDLRYNLKLTRTDGEGSEALAVGSLWHLAHAAAAKHPEDANLPYTLIAQRAPSPLWAEKLSRLFAAYKWYWEKSDRIKIIEPEHQFAFELPGWIRMRGSIDAVVEIDGRIGIMERKTTSDDLNAGSAYWDRLKLDRQVGIYALGTPTPPAFILYDVVRKPSIRPKSIPAKEVNRMRAEAQNQGHALYYGESFTPDEVASAILQDQETIRMYGARLTSEIGNEPDRYFGRREVVRTDGDLERLRYDIFDLVETINRGVRYRNPDACDAFGTCEFFNLCHSNVDPQIGTDGRIIPPSGYAIRKHEHPELDGIE